MNKTLYTYITLAIILISNNSRKNFTQKPLNRCLSSINYFNINVRNYIIRIHLFNIPYHNKKKNKKKRIIHANRPIIFFKIHNHPQTSEFN